MLDSTFMGDIREPFNSRRFSIARSPIEGFRYDLAKPNRRWESRNHWMIKSKNHDFIILDELEPDVRRFCQKAIDFMRAFRLPFEDRYLYLTVDDRYLEKGDFHREPGWHFDGMQGSEVPTANPGCFQFLWCNHSPMEYSDQAFQTKGLNRHEVNFFESLGNQVQSDSVRSVEPEIAYLMSPYQMHRGAPSQISGRRKILRLSASHQPITSIKMTVNPLMPYDYPVHSTLGEIPGHLRVLYQKSAEYQYLKAG